MGIKITKVEQMEPQSNEATPILLLWESVPEESNFYLLGGLDHETFDKTRPEGVHPHGQPPGHLRASCAGPLWLLHVGANVNREKRLKPRLSQQEKRKWPEGMLKTLDELKPKVEAVPFCTFEYNASYSLSLFERVLVFLSGKIQTKQVIKVKTNKETELLAGEAQPLPGKAFRFLFSFYEGFKK
jgi:hypothetical protein